MANHGDGRTAEEPTAHVIFELEVEDGWPPVASERVWAYDVGGLRPRSTLFGGNVGERGHAV